MLWAIAKNDGNGVKENYEFKSVYYEKHNIYHGDDRCVGDREEEEQGVGEEGEEVEGPEVRGSQGAAGELFTLQEA